MFVQSVSRSREFSKIQQLIKVWILQVPFCEEKSVQLVRLAFFRSDFLQNPYFSEQIFQKQPNSAVAGKKRYRLRIAHTLGCQINE